MFQDEDEVVYEGRKRLAYGSGILIVAWVAIWNTLADPNSSRLWTGGFLVAGLFYYQAIRIYLVVFQNRKAFRLGPPAYGRIDFGLIAASILLAVTACISILPEFFKVTSPAVGTCWAADGDSVSPVACWSGEVQFRTVLMPLSANDCPTARYLKPDAEGQPFTCLEPAG